VLVSTLGQVAEDAAARGLRPPAVVVVGEVVRLREALGPEEPAREAAGPATLARDRRGAA